MAVRWWWVNALLASAILTPAENVIGQSDFGACAADDDWHIGWSECAERTTRFVDPRCRHCDPGKIRSVTAGPHVTQLTDDHLLLVLTYGVSDTLAADLDAAAWHERAFVRDPTAGRMPTGPSFTLQRDTTGFIEPGERSGLSVHVTTLLPERHARRRAGYAREYTVALGTVWGYRWSTISGRVVADVDHPRSLNYGFQFLGKVAPKWRYVLAVDRVRTDLDLVGEALWRIRPDAYVSVTTKFTAEEHTPAFAAPDLRVNFSFK